MKFQLKVNDDRVSFCSLKAGDVFSFSSNKNLLLMKIEDKQMRFYHEPPNTGAFVQAILLENGLPFCQRIDREAFVYRLDGKFIEE